MPEPSLTGIFRGKWRGGLADNGTYARNQIDGIRSADVNKAVVVKARPASHPGWPGFG